MAVPANIERKEKGKMTKQELKVLLEKVANRKIDVESAVDLIRPSQTATQNTIRIQQLERQLERQHRNSNYGNGSCQY